MPSEVDNVVDVALFVGLLLRNKCQSVYLVDICRHSTSPGDRGVPICENVFAAIDPTCQRELAGNSSSSSQADHQHHFASTNLTAQPIIPADINIARRRAPLGIFFYISCSSFLLYCVPVKMWHFCFWYNSVILMHFSEMYIFGKFYCQFNKSTSIVLKSRNIKV